MIRKIAFLVVGLAMSGTVMAAERPVLRSEAVVTDNLVRIGDLIDNAGVIADVPVFRAPALGQTGTVSAGQVIDAVRAHALVGLDPGPVTEVTVTRASRAITPGEIEAALTDSLTRTYRLGDAADISLNFERPLRVQHVEPTVTGAPHVDQLRYDSRTGRFSGTLTVAGAPHLRLRLAGTAVVTAEAVELLHPLARGEVIKSADVVMRRIPRVQVTPETITDLKQAIGLAARGTINPGRPLRSSELTKPQVVQRNDNVTIVYRVPGLMLAVRGKANDSGAEGDMIDVLNMQSNRTVRGTIIGPGQVAVTPITARIFAAATPSNPDAHPNRAK
jgi:flagella basal body P-ring formation protein FlgA